MKKIILILCILLSFKGFSQEIYSSPFYQKYVLFLGSTKENQMKMLNLNSNKIEWINMNSVDMQQVNVLSPSDFVDAVFSNNLYFQAEGNIPYWTATIKKGMLFFNNTQFDNNNSFPITIDTDQKSESSNFEFMFYNADKSIFGTVKKMQQQICPYCNNDEKSIFEVIINYQGDIYKGCAIIKEN